MELGLPQEILILFYFILFLNTHIITWGTVELIISIIINFVSVAS